MGEKGISRTVEGEGTLSTRRKARSSQKHGERGSRNESGSRSRGKSNVASAVAGKGGV